MAKKGNKTAYVSVARTMLTCDLADAG